GLSGQGVALTPPLASTPFRCASQHLLTRHRLAICPFVGKASPPTCVGLLPAKRRARGEIPATPVRQVCSAAFVATDATVHVTCAGCPTSPSSRNSPEPTPLSRSIP